MVMTVEQVLSRETRWTVEQGDCLDFLRTLPDASVDSIVCDPPAGIGFMGKEWDGNKGGRDEWIAWLAERMREAFRALKPGGHALVWALPRTSHWTAMALEDAGFEVRDRIAHLFGSGFPKSMDVSKGIDKLAGADREVIGRAAWKSNNAANAVYGKYNAVSEHLPVTAPATDEAKRWHGWGTALKPAAEDWWLVRKPFKGSVVRNVLEHGTGAINIGGCRVPHASAEDLAEHTAGVEAIKERGGRLLGSWKNSSDLGGVNDVTDAGRWPAHILLTHADGCERVGVRRAKAPENVDLFEDIPAEPAYETIEHWQCVEGCPVAMLDGQSGTSESATHPSQRWGRTAPDGWGMADGGTVQGYGDEGGASRYFTTFAPFIYTPKCDRTDREKGCEYLPAVRSNPHGEGSRGAASPHAGTGRLVSRRNHHPTVKSTDLMRWLVRLITPPDGVVLDPFTGSGSTGVACSAERFRFIGCELSPEYAAIARARIVGDAPLLNAGGL